MKGQRCPFRGHLDYVKSSAGCGGASGSKAGLSRKPDRKRKIGGHPGCKDRWTCRAPFRTLQTQMTACIPDSWTPGLFSGRSKRKSQPTCPTAEPSGLHLATPDANDSLHPRQLEPQEPMWAAANASDNSLSDSRSPSWRVSLEAR